MTKERIGVLSADINLDVSLGTNLPYIVALSFFAVSLNLVYFTTLEIG